VLSVRRFRWLLAVAAVFHLAVLLTMQINFATNIVLYALLVPTAALAAQAQHAAAFGRLRVLRARLGRREGTLIYDGDCGFCARFAGWAQAHGSAVASSTQAPELLAAHGPATADGREASWWVDRYGDGAPLRGQHAIAHVLWLMRGRWALVGLLAQLPARRMPAPWPTG